MYFSSKHYGASGLLIDLYIIDGHHMYIYIKEAGFLYIEIL